MPATPKTARREFLQLADTYNPQKHKIARWYISEKLDGTRCFWDGGITRGVSTRKIPWASVTDPKTGQPKSKVKPLATGLWSRYGNPIIAPEWFLNALPSCPLDGELWAGRGNFQLCRSICGGDEPDERFKQISYAVYSSPSLAAIFQDGLIKNANMVRDIRQPDIQEFVHERLAEFNGDFKFVEAGWTFEQELLFLTHAIDTQNDHCFLHRQIRLSADEDEAVSFASNHLFKLIDEGAEGLIFRDPSAVWTPKRHKGLLKYKPYSDAEGTVVGFTSGRETDKGSRLRGKIGALILDYNGKRLEIAGLNDEERQFSSQGEDAHAWDFPGEDMPEGTQGLHFKLGQLISFKYRELSDDGIPKEARYFRQRDVE